MSITSYNSTLTSRYQTTIPAPVRQILGLEKQDKVKYVIHSDGSVTIVKVEVEEDQSSDDPVIKNFLEFLENDMQKNPENIVPFPSDLWERIASLVDGMDVDLDAPLDPEDE